MHKYKVGDKVIIHSLNYLKSITTIYNEDGILRLPTDLCLPPSMQRFCGKVLTIRTVNVRHPTWFYVEESSYTFSEEMVKGIAGINLGEIYD